MFTDSNLDSLLIAAGLSYAHLETAPAVIYILRPDLRIVYCNRAWDKFAYENNGKGLNRSEVLGTVISDAIPGPLKKFYAQAFVEVRETGNIWEHDFECSSPELFRLFHMRVLPLSEGHILVENSLRLEEFHRRNSPAPGDHVAYVNEHGLLTMCCHCRRTRRIGSGEKETWDWIPRFLIEQPGRVSHGLCRTCMAYFHPDVASGAGAKTPASIGHATYRK
jgi:hypothetical protein